MSIRFSKAVCALSLVSTLAIVQPIPAQSTQARIRSVTRFTLKIDRAADMAAAIKEYNAVLKKAGWDKSYVVWRSVTGPAELVLVQYHEKWSELDANMMKDPKLKDYEAEIARITTRINDSFLSISREIDLINADLSLPRTPEPPKYIMLWTAHVKQGKMRDAIETEKNEYVPALKSAGVKSYTFATTRFGGPASQLRASVGLDSWANLDETNPVRKAMGDEKYRAFSDKMSGFLEDYRYDIYRFDKELSYMPAKQGPNTGN